MKIKRPTAHHAAIAKPKAAKAAPKMPAGLSKEQQGIAQRSFAKFGKMPSLSAINGTLGRNHARLAKQNAARAQKAAAVGKARPVVGGARPGSGRPGFASARPSGLGGGKRMPKFVFGRRVS